jgi:hypothetical protein
MDDDYLIKVNSFLLFVCLMGVFLIGVLVFHITNLNEDISKEILNMGDKIPKCAECPKCELKCPEHKECPECPKCPDMKVSSPGQPLNHLECPSVDQIVQGVFPGRNPKVVKEGRYFEVDAANNYDGLSTSNFYKQKYDFPMEKILKPDKPLRDYNIQGEDTINNSISNNDVSYSQKSKKMLKNDPIPSNTHSVPNYLESNKENNKEN